MKEEGWGRSVPTGSANAKEPEGAFRHVLVNTTRASTIGQIETVADEYARYGITNNRVAPGWVATQSAYADLQKNVGLEADEARSEWRVGHARVPAVCIG